MKTFYYCMSIEHPIPAPHASLEFYKTSSLYVRFKHPILRSRADVTRKKRTTFEPTKTHDLVLSPSLYPASRAEVKSFFFPALNLHRSIFGFAQITKSQKTHLSPLLP